MRSGATLVEALIALALGAIVCASLGALLHTQAQVATSVTGIAARAEAVRTAQHVLAEELRWVAPHADVRSLQGDSAAVRLLRGIALPCGRAGGLLLVRYRGARLPEPLEDSLLPANGGDRAIGIAGAQGSEGCVPAHDERVLALDVGARVDAPYFLLFESGTYYLRDRALRFRIGAEGRQPLTDEWLATPAAAMTLRRNGVRATARLLIRPRADHAFNAAIDTLHVTLPNAWKQ